MFVVIKEFQDAVYKDTFYSYESGPEDQAVFFSKKAAELYAKKISYRLKENERFTIEEV